MSWPFHRRSVAVLRAESLLEHESGVVVVFSTNLEGESRSVELNRHPSIPPAGQSVRCGLVTLECGF